jgi:hypothetical protein
VEVDVRIRPGHEPSTKEIPSLYDRLKPVIGRVKDLPADAARNVDHYFYGHPKP